MWAAKAYGKSYTGKEKWSWVLLEKRIKVIRNKRKNPSTI